MPFKTRKQKESASVRRYTFGDVETVSYNSSKSEDKSGESKAHSSKHITHISEDFFYVKGDLLRILGLCLVIILVQAILKFAQSANLLHF